MTRGISILGAAVVALAVCGCSSMRPLYGSSGLSSGVSTELSSIVIPEPKTRLEQLIRNDLVAAMRPAGAAGDDRYTLVLKPEAKDDKAIEAQTTDTLRKTVRLNVGFSLLDRRTSNSVYSGRTFSQVSYDETGQSFADLQARTNALERAAHEVSSDIRTRLAAHFASG
jgi:LPS-assembly lipoprotein